MRMCVKKDIWLHKTHMFELNVTTTRQTTFTEVRKLFARGGCGGGGWMEEKKKQLSQITVILLY